MNMTLEYLLELEGWAKEHMCKPFPCKWCGRQFYGYSDGVSISNDNNEEIICKDCQWKQGLYREVVEHDCYGIKKLDFVPEVIIDIGANIGIFSRYARETFPEASICAYEPDPDNFVELEKVEDIYSYNVALGNGPVYHKKSVFDGSHEHYYSAGVGYPEKLIDQKDLTVCEAMRFSEIMNWRGAGKLMLKCDCEGSELSIFEDEQEFSLLGNVDYIAMEIHRFAILGGKLLADVQVLVDQSVERLKITHEVIMNGPIMLARKRHG